MEQVKIKGTMVSVSPDREKVNIEPWTDESLSDSVDVHLHLNKADFLEPRATVFADEDGRVDFVSVGFSGYRSMDGNCDYFEGHMYLSENQARGLYAALKELKL